MKTADHLQPLHNEDAATPAPSGLTDSQLTDSKPPGDLSHTGMRSIAEDLLQLEVAEARRLMPLVNDSVEKAHALSLVLPSVAIEQRLNDVCEKAKALTKALEIETTAIDISSSDAK